ncbi:transposable element Tcb2 transposase [Trichonephila clavipes]|nr:transposable element Tcb2 transposase [Trichonephila clavipes]
MVRASDSRPEGLAVSYRVLKLEVNKEKIRFFLQFFFDKGENTSQVTEIAHGVHGADTVIANYVQFWFRRFRSGIFDVKDTPRTGRSVVENIDKITEIIKVDRPVSSRSITQELKIDPKTVLSHLRKVGFKKKLHVWVPHQLSISGKEIARRIAVKITPSCCLSEKWRIIHLLDDIWMLLPEVESLGEKLEKGRSVTSVAAEFGIAHSIVSRLWRQFQTTGTAIRGFSRGRPRGTTPADDRYIVLQARRNRRQTAGEIARHTTQATGRPISRFTVARRLHGGGLFARRPVRCVPLTPAHRRRRFLWCREHWNWRDNEWGRVLFTDESRFSLSSDSHRILIWRERGSRNHPPNIIERDRYGGRGVLVWGGIMLGSRTDLHIFDAGSVNGTRY